MDLSNAATAGVKQNKELWRAAAFKISALPVFVCRGNKGLRSGTVLPWLAHIALFEGSEFRLRQLFKRHHG